MFRLCPGADVCRRGRRHRAPSRKADTAAASSSSASSLRRLQCSIVSPLPGLKRLSQKEAVQFKLKTSRSVQTKETIIEGSSSVQTKETIIEGSSSVQDSR